MLKTYKNYCLLCDEEWKLALSKKAASLIKELSEGTISRHQIVAEIEQVETELERDYFKSELNRYKDEIYNKNK